MISRRLIRIRAMQDLYSFFIKRKVEFHDKLSGYLKDYPYFDFINELKLDHYPSLDKIETKEDYKKGVDLFRNAVNKYEKQTIDGINDLDTQIKRLSSKVIFILTSWYQISKSKTETDELLKKNNVPVVLSQNFSKSSFLKLLSEDSDIEDFVTNRLTEKIDPGLINEWYNNILRNNKHFREYSLINDPTLKDEYKFIETLLKRIIFGEEKIVEFFENKEANISIILEPSKVFLLDILRDFLEKKEKNSKFIFSDSEIITQAERDFYYDLVTGIFRNEVRLISEIKNNLDKWDLERVILIDFVILLLGVYEIFYLRDIPDLVSLDEYIEISKEYSTEKSKIFINGVLHSLTTKLKIKMKKRNKYEFVLLSGVLIGVVTGILLAPAKGESLRSKIIFRIKNFGNWLANVIINVFSKKPEFDHKSKESGNRLVTNAKTKANKLLEDIQTIKTKS